MRLTKEAANLAALNFLGRVDESSGVLVSQEKREDLGFFCVRVFEH